MYRKTEFTGTILCALTGTIKNIRYPDGYLRLSAEDAGFDIIKEATSF